MNDIAQGKGYGYMSSDGRICMVRCFECGAENWALKVSTGTCAWCAYDPNTDLNFNLEPEREKE